MSTATLRHRRNALILLLAAYLVGGAQVTAATDTPAPQDFLRSHMDLSVDPGADFFDYANGGWLAHNPIPPAESWWGVGSLVNEQLYSSLRTINENAASSPQAAGSELQKIADFWSTAMDTAHADSLGAHPLDSDFARIDQAQNVRDVLDLAFAFMPLGINVFFDISVSQDEKNSGAMALHLSQGGLGLPDRDFYFNSERGVARARREYLAHMTRVMQLLGHSAQHAQAQARSVLSFETALARSSRKLEDLNDPDRNYHRITPAVLTAKYTPSIDWSARLAVWNVHPEFVIVGQPEFYTQLQQLIRHTPVSVLRDYLRVHLLDTYASTLSRPFDEEQFRFYGQILSGKQE
ncbi:MAG TPA: M13 family metallopeptidase N-terminal domain-containing protein, partial [Steroidobacteraceae bacterium]|nr:M13 family metallopeptidase N-terminal domain-containing protein [Steroidobacteraceae bacterium]